ncbi:MAG: LuxR C-terminal-related transcriptional regulator, partial [Sphingomonadales bacterium]|nr:LuxR C-terminal-related transcriptional regulator [Sphingomonadales bacterium]
EHYDAHGAAGLRAAVELLSNGIVACTKKITLHIDDFHFTAESDSAALFHRLVEVQPGNLKILLTSRTPPDLPIAALKVENRLLYLSWERLNFSADEAIAFFDASLEGRVPAELATEIHEKTEGWAAGLQLALLKFQISDRLDTDVSYIPGYAQDVAAYFEAEIYAALPEEVQSFLLKTSVLDRMTDALAAQVAEIGTDAARKIFEDLERRGFFIISLDERGVWKRYHHLFQEFVAAIRERQQPGLERRLAGRASAWYEAQGISSEAIDYAIRAEDFARASALVEAHAIDLFNRGSISALADCIRRMPQALTVRRPQLPLYLCFLYAHMCQPIDGILRQYEASKTTIDTLHAVNHFGSQADYEALLRELEAVAVIVQFRNGDMAGVIRRAEAILDGMPELRGVFAASLYNVAGYAHFTQGANALARPELRRAREIHLAEECVIGVVYAECFAGLVEASEGLTSNALAHFEAARNYATSKLGEGSLPTALARLYQAVLDYELNKLGEVEANLPASLARLQDCCEPEIYAKAMVAQHKFLFLRGHLAESRALIGEAVDYARRIGNAPLHLCIMHAQLSALIAAGEAPEAMRVFTEAQAVWNRIPEEAGTGGGRVRLWRDLIRAETLQATARPRAAIEIYEALADWCKTHNRIHRLIFVLAKLALARASVGETHAAMNAMTEALKYGRSSGFVRTFLDMGAGALDLVRLCKAETIDPDTACFAEALLNADTMKEDAPERVVLQELTERELAILKRLMGGAKNREICADLDLAENTVKWYLKRIFNKLGASNRTEAALIAKSLFAAL